LSHARTDTGVTDRKDRAVSIKKEGIMSEKKPIGQVLMESGMITIDDLNESIEIQKSSSQMLGEILIGMGAITEEELQLALEFQNY